MAAVLLHGADRACGPDLRAAADRLEILRLRNETHGCADRGTLKSSLPKTLGKRGENPEEENRMRTILTGVAAAALLTAGAAQAER
ncbi:MAG: hypothetical protein QHC91_19955 [Shinella sp.]|nr:hypothetical protein [Shinella sp.]MDX3976408.1 hypothetical protein [Shinella sp.]